MQSPSKSEITLYNQAFGLYKFNAPPAELFNRRLLTDTLEMIEDKVYAYNDIIKINVSNLCEIDEIFDLPHNLQELHINYTCVREIQIPRECTSLKVLVIKDSNLREMPENLHLQTSLHTLYIENAFISNIPDALPRSLENINLSGNNLSENSTNLHVLPERVQILLFKNNFGEKPSMPNHLLCFGTQGAPRRTKITNFNVMRRLHAETLAQVHAPVPFATSTPKKPEDMFNSTQTVHLTSINKSVQKSVEKIIELTSHKYSKIKEGYLVFQLLEEAYPTGEMYVGHLLKNTFHLHSTELMSLRDKILTWTMLETPHTATKTTYGEMLARVWILIKHHEQKADFIENLKIELAASDGVCFTGKYNRLINSLVGFVDGITVGISMREQLQIEIGKYIAKLSSEQISYDECKKAIQDLLEDPEVAEDSSITEDYKNAWMDALEDYKPAPEDFQAELEARIAERKNII